MNQLRTTSEVADQLRCKPRQVREMCAAGELTYVPKGRAYLIPQDEVDRWVRMHTIHRASRRSA